MRWRAAWLAVAGSLLLLGDLATPSQGTAWTRTITLAALPLVLPVARLSLSGGWATYIAIAGGLLAGPVHSIFYDPLRDPACIGCYEGAFGTSANLNAARALAVAGAILAAAGLAAGARWRAPASILLGLVAVAEMIGLAPLVAARAGVAVAAVALGADVVARWWSGRRLELLIDSLGATPDAASLAAAERDASHGEWVPSEVRLGLEHARLRLELDQQAAALAESRRRIVDRADEEARRLERDLHDGAQSHLLNLGMGVAALHAARPSPNLSAALVETRKCLEELRSVARSAFPPVLESAGLGPAVVALTGGRLARMDLPSRRFDPVAERTAYLLVAEVHRHAVTPISVSGRLRGDRLELTVTGPAPSADAVIHDRVAALGGTMTSDDVRTEASLPCA